MTKRNIGGNVRKGKKPGEQLVCAVLSNIPLPGERWPAAARVAWLKMITTAFDVCFGSDEEICVGLKREERPKFAAVAQAEFGDGGTPPKLARRDEPLVYKIDKHGFALRNNLPINIEHLPPEGCGMLDFRAGPDALDWATIMWATGGVSSVPQPVGVTLLRPALHEALPDGGAS